MYTLHFNVRYIKDYPGKYNLNKDEIAPQTYAMYWCMLATGVHRIFTQEVLHEFLFRLGISLSSLEIVENWFAYDKLIPFTYNQTPYSLCIQDVFNHIGFQALDDYQDMALRQEYTGKIGRFIRNAMLVEELAAENIQVLDPVQKDTDKYLISGKPLPSVLTKDLTDKATIFANEVIKMVPEGLFAKAFPLLKDKMDEVAERKEKVESIPAFSPEILDESTVEQCMMLMLGEDEVKKLQQKPDKYKKESHRLIYLAWLFANALVWSDGYGWNIHEGVNVDIFDYEEEHGINLNETYERYNMVKCEGLLKEIGNK